MTQVLKAIFDGEVFKPEEPVKIPAQTTVELVVRVPENGKKGKPYSLFHALTEMNLHGPSDWSEHFEDYLNGTRKLEL